MRGIYLLASAAIFYAPIASGRNVDSNSVVVRFVNKQYGTAFVSDQRLRGRKPGDKVNMYMRTDSLEQGWIYVRPQDALPDMEQVCRDERRIFFGLIRRYKAVHIYYATAVVQ